MLENIVLVVQLIVYASFLIMALAAMFMMCVMLVHDFKEYLKEKKRGK